MQPRGIAPAPLEDYHLGHHSCSSQALLTPVRHLTSPHYSDHRGAPLLSPTSPLHAIHAGNPNVSLRPTPGCPDGGETSHVVCPGCGQAFEPIVAKDHIATCAQLTAASSSSLPPSLRRGSSLLAEAAARSQEPPSGTSGPQCDFCGEHLSLDGTGSNNVHFMQDCDHVFSRECLGRYIHGCAKRYKATPQMVTCPAARGCGKPLSSVDLLSFLSSEEHNLLLQNEMAAFLDDSGTEGYAQCPCCAMAFEHVPASPANAWQTEVSGRQLSGEHYLHYKRNRLRCLSCSADFCHECLETPYHTGHTCAEFKSLAVARTCRFCSDPVPSLGSLSSTSQQQASLPPGLRPQQAPVGLDNKPADPALPQKPPAPPLPPPSSSALQALANLTSPRKGVLLTCGSAECEKNNEQACAKVLPCGHACPGIAGEASCPPCFVDGCPSIATEGAAVSGSSWCSICYTEDLRSAPCITLSCGHAYHFKCVKNQLLQKWPGARISFGFMNCPQCAQPITHPALTSILKDLEAFRAEVRNGALIRLKHEGRDKDEAVASPDGAFHGNPEGYAEAILSYYQCYVCEKPYFGGVRQCDALNMEVGRYNPSELVCAGCVPFRDLKSCRIHGNDFIEYKCKFCCSVAQWFCWGTTHFCLACHRMQERGDFVTKKKPADLPQCPGRAGCPLRVDHPTNGTEEFALGCAVCRVGQHSI